MTTVPAAPVRFYAVRKPVAAFLAGIGVGAWSGPEEVAATWRLDRRFEPSMPQRERERLMGGWRRAVERSLGWAVEG